MNPSNKEITRAYSAPEEDKPLLPPWSICPEPTGIEPRKYDPDRWFMDRDSDGHWYLLPDRLRAVWNELNPLEDGWQDERWNEIEQHMLGGHPNTVSFTDPIQL